MNAETAAWARRRSGTRASRAWCAALALIVVSVLQGCGYSTGLAVKERHRTIGLAVFGNQSYERDIERLFYDEMARALRDTCDATLVDPADADVVVHGDVLAYRRRSGIRSPENKLLETGVYIQVRASLQERGSVVPKAPAVTSDTWVGYVIEGLESERTARDRALRYLADELVLELFGPLN